MNPIETSPKSEPEPMSGKSERERAFFSYHPSMGTTEGDTYAYLLCNDAFDRKRGKALANQAIVAWWLAYARRANHEQARQTAIDCIEQLEQHIAKLRRDFQIPQIPPAMPPYQGMTLYQDMPVAAPGAAVSQRQARQGQISQRQDSPPIAAPTDRETELPDDSLYGQFDMEETLEAE